MSRIRHVTIEEDDELRGLAKEYRHPLMVAATPGERRASCTLVASCRIGPRG